jgi:hypothetical protein
MTRRPLHLPSPQEHGFGKTGSDNHSLAQNVFFSTELSRHPGSSRKTSDISAPGEIVISNTLYHALPGAEQAAFADLDPIEAKNMGRVRAWKLMPPRPS